jgi:hypothetical protein
MFPSLLASPSTPRPRRRGAALSWRWALLSLLAAGLLPAGLFPADRRDGGAITVLGDVVTFRRAPRTRDGGGGGAALLLNGDFASGLDGWSTSQSGGSASPGSVEAENAAAVLREGDSFLVTLWQEFQVPPRAATLSFTVRLDPGFDPGDASLPDAFEVSLLDASQLPVLAAWSEQATSFLNFQETGAVHAATGVAWDGARAKVDLSGLPPGETVTLYFDLIGADGDAAGALRVDDVEVSVEPEPSFLRGDPNLDALVDIADPLRILFFMFAGAAAPACLDAADADNDGRIAIDDPISLLAYLFLGRTPPPAPFPACGPDAGGEDELDCGPCSCSGSVEGGPCP